MLVFKLSINLIYIDGNENIIAVNNQITKDKILRHPLKLGHVFKLFVDCKYCSNIDTITFNHLRKLVKPLGN